ncbi:hypothetical protein ACFWIX_02160 [Pseudarthrobacter sp. NPDC058362]|uniref:hypothetical protein n=1 Tax=unclassified Pseudarthrobacter TaxID=2647000 RepID=UPI00366183C7
MDRISHLFLGVATTTVLVAAMAVPSSAATSSDTATTVVVTGGGLSITAPATAALSDAAPSSTATANIAGVQVTDTRAGTIGWSATVRSTDFTPSVGGAGSIPATAAAYIPSGMASVTGLAVVTPSSQSDLSTPKTVQTATMVVGNNAASWTAAFQVAIPSTAVAGTYSGTLTHSVL